MKVSITLFAILFITSLSFSQNRDVIIGKYHLPNDLDVEIYKQNNKYFGKIIALNGFEDGQTMDINNPDRSKHKDLLIGKVIIKNLEYDPAERIWINGSMYGSEKGMFFDLKITEIKNTEITIVGSKYFMWRTLSWKKI